MSHTTTISTLLLSDEHAIRAAIADLKQRGVKCELLENAIPRSYPGNQMKAAPMVLKLNEADYDIGFYRNEDGQGFNAATDFYRGSVERVLGAEAREGDDRMQARLGKFYQSYAIHAATRQANKQGMNVRRINRNDGSVQLVVTG